MVTEEALEGGREFFFLPRLSAESTEAMRPGLAYLFGAHGLARRFAFALGYVNKHARVDAWGSFRARRTILSFRGGRFRDSETAGKRAQGTFRGDGRVGCARVVWWWVVTSARAQGKV